MNAHTQDIDKLFQKTKGNLFYQKGAGFLGPLLCKVKFQWRSDISTACISPKNLFWNPDFFLSLDKDSRVTVLAHELNHNALLHGVRRGDRCPDLWNQAADHVINLWLQEHGYYMGGFPYLMDPKYKGWATEAVYDDLEKNGGKASGGSRPLGDDILPVDPNDEPQAINDVVSAVTTARMTGSAGTIPGETEMVIDKFLNPKLPWEILLRNHFNELTNQEYSYARPNRRYDDPIMPGMTGRNGLEHLMFFQDVSYSISDDNIFRFNSELKHIKDEFQPELMTVCTFDTSVRDTYVFEKDDPYDKIIVNGRGGTDLEDVFEKIQEERPTLAIIFTDMEVYIPDDPGIPILWICVDNPKATAPYGRLIHIDD